MWVGSITRRFPSWCIRTVSRPGNSNSTGICTAWFRPLLKRRTSRLRWIGKLPWGLLGDIPRRCSLPVSARRLDRPCPVRRGRSRLRRSICARLGRSRVPVAVAWAGRREGGVWCHGRFHRRQPSYLRHRWYLLPFGCACFLHIQAGFGEIRWHSCGIRQDRAGDGVMGMDIWPIRTEADYDWALSEIEVYFRRDRRTSVHAAGRSVRRARGAHCGVRAAALADRSTRPRCCYPPSDGAGYTQGDLARLLGSRSRASEILAGRRGLTMEQVRRLHEAWNIPAEALIRPSRAATRVADA